MKEINSISSLRPSLIIKQIDIIIFLFHIFHFFLYWSPLSSDKMLQIWGKQEGLVLQYHIRL